MIANHQPALFETSLLVRVSARDDGTVLDRTIDVHERSIVRTRSRFCDSIDVDYSDVVFQRIIYDEHATYSLIAEVDKRSTTRYSPEVVADALYTETKGVGLFLPVADCIATIVYDPQRPALALLHLGRHSTLTNLISKMLSHFRSHGSQMSDLVVWMSPSAQKSSYYLDHFDVANSPAWKEYCTAQDGKLYLDMQGYNKHAFIQKGVLVKNIHVSQTDTVTDPDYFSHFAGDSTGRQAVVAMMR